MTSRDDGVSLISALNTAGGGLCDGGAEVLASKTPMWQVGPAREESPIGGQIQNGGSPPSTDKNRDVFSSVSEEQDEAVRGDFEREDHGDGDGDDDEYGDDEDGEGRVSGVKSESSGGGGGNHRGQQQHQQRIKVLEAMLERERVSPKP